jgi:hypothetical protein
MEQLGLKCVPPAVASYCGPGMRRTTVEPRQTIEKYGPAYAPEETIAGHLKFALKNEPLDMGLIAAACKAIKPTEIEEWVRHEPNGAFARRAWFMYEWFTETTIDLPNAGVVTYATALNPRLNMTSIGRSSPRHKIIDNMFGVPGFCLTVRPTAAIIAYRASAIDQQAAKLVRDCDPEILARAVNYLYTKETKSSFEIERERPTAQRAERFVAALRDSRTFNPTDKKDLVALQNTIVDPRYAAKGFRDFQNFVGETMGGYREKVHFICPRPEDIEDLMEDWTELVGRLRGSEDPVAAAALIAFSFVFLHPFEDGNGRIHRFLIHHVLSREGFTPPDILFPVSAAIVRDRKGYDSALESFSKPLLPLVDWQWDQHKEIVVNNDTAPLYRYFDATTLVEFLYAKIEETVHKDLREELDFVAVYDAAVRAVVNVIDMPDRKASLFATLCLQNGGTLSKKKREQFHELSDGEIGALEIAIREAVDDVNSTRNDKIDAN